MDSLNKPEPLSLEGDVNENWRKFKRKYELYILATGTAVRTKVVQAAVLLNLIGDEGLELYDTFGLTVEQSKDPEEIMQAFENYAKPQLNQTFERFVFMNRGRQENESLDHYVKELKRLVKTCEYGELTESMVRDNIIRNMKDVTLQQNLLKIRDLTLTTLLENIKLSEVSRKQVTEMQRSQQKQATNAIDELKTKDYRQGARSGEKNRSPDRGRKSYRGTSPRRGRSREREYSSDRDNWRDSRGSARGKEKEGRASRSTGSPYRQRSTQCSRCETRHGPRQCPAYNHQCRKCNRYGHFPEVCRVRDVSEVNPYGNDSSDSEYYIDSIQIGEIQKVERNPKVWREIVYVEENPVKFKIDTGSAVNILPLRVLRKINSQLKIRQTRTVLESFGGFRVQPVGTVRLSCEFKKVEAYLDFVITDVDSVPLLGLEATEMLGLIKRIHEVKSIRKGQVIGKTEKGNDDKTEFLKSNTEVFNGLGKFPGAYKITVDKKIRPTAKPPRRVPGAVKGKLKTTLQRLEDEGIISRVEKPTSWVSNMVIREKPDGSLRICLDPKELNSAISRPYYEIPTVQDLSAKLTNKSFYTVLDLKEGFWQVALDEESSEVCAFSTPFGCYKFNRLPFGINCAPEIFQKLNEENFADLPGTVIYFDDVLVAGDTVEEHDENLRRVMERAKERNVKFNGKKLQYRQTSVRYVGHVFSQKGKAVDPERIRSIVELKDPSSKKELQRILGMVNYIRDFVPQMSGETAQLRELLRSSVTWNWLPIHSKILRGIKEKICNAPVLKNFDESKESTIQTDASKDGLGCCLMQEKQPVAFASRSLTETEKNYSQSEKEMLSIVFSVKRFHNYIYGRHVTMLTDHKPLVSAAVKDVSKIASSRLQRLKLKLLNYDLTVKYLPGKYMYIADTLSRSYLPCQEGDECDLTQVVHSVSKNLAMSEAHKEGLRDTTARDAKLQQVVKYCKNGWPEHLRQVDIEIKGYWKIRAGIHEAEGLVFLDHKVIIPTEYRSTMLEKLHEGHLGITKMKARARQLLYWPGITDDIENKAKKCATCAKFKPANVKETLIPHEIPDLPYQKVGADVLEYAGKNYLVVMDYLSKWLDVIPMKYKTANAIVAELKKLFAIHGIPQQLVADNMSFASYECKQFAKEWQFEIVTSSPHFPQSNGMAEKAVHIAKQMLRKCDHDGTDFQLAILQHRNAPVAGLAVSPAQILMSRQTKTKLPVSKMLLKPKVQSTVQEELKNRQQKIKSNYDKTARRKSVTFDEGQNIYIRKEKHWTPGLVLSRHSAPRSYMVQDEQGHVLRRNTRHLCGDQEEIGDQGTANEKDAGEMKTGPEQEVEQDGESEERPMRQLRDRNKIIRPRRYEN